MIKRIVSLETRKKLSEFHKGLKHSKKTKQKISESLKGRIFSEEHKRKISESEKRKIISKETRQKMSEARKGIKLSEKTKRKMSEARKGENNPNWGKQHSKETREKIKKVIKEWHKNNPHPRGMLGKNHSENAKKAMSQERKGEKNGNWHGGVSFEPYGLEFNKELKEQIRERDDYICQKCETKENRREFPVHHIDYNKQNNKPENLITLCDSCHAGANSNRKYWQNYFVNIIQNKEVYNERRRSFGIGRHCDCDYAGDQEAY